MVPQDDETESNGDPCPSVFNLFVEGQPKVLDYAQNHYGDPPGPSRHLLGVYQIYHDGIDQDQDEDDPLYGYAGSSHACVAVEYTHDQHLSDPYGWENILKNLATHEIGHTMPGLGGGHCPESGCVMKSGNLINSSFCLHCIDKLRDPDRSGEQQ
jgi:hypothetical protein